MSLARTNTTNAYAIGERYGFEREKVELIKSQIAQGASDSELSLFLYTAQRVGLDPLARQIYCIMRKDKGVEKMTIQTGIDGYRLIADRTGNYAPGRANTFEYDANGKVESATAYVMKYVRGQWLEVSATAYWDEYVSTYRDGNPMGLWGTKPRVMLGKCAEALALRRAFPAELSGIYTAEEMGTEVSGDSVTVISPPAPRQIAAPVDALAQEAFDMQDELYDLDNTFVGKSLEKLEQIGRDDRGKLRDYHQRLADRILDLHANANPEPVAADESADDDSGLFTDDPNPSPRSVSDDEIAFFQDYGALIGGTTWAHVMTFFGHNQQRPTTPEGWEQLAQAVGIRMDETMTE